MQASATASAVNPRPFTERNAALIPVWLLLTFNIYWVFWTYKTYQEIRQHSPQATTITPGGAVGFLFIPFFNVFWFLRLMLDLPRALARVQAQCTPHGEVLPRGHLSCMLIAGLVFNVLGGYVHPGMLVAGEILLASGFVICQSRMNEHNRVHQGAQVSARARETVAGLIGAAAPGLDWLRVAVFAVATLVGYLVINLGTQAALGGSVNLDWRWAVTTLSWTLLATAGGLLAFRLLRNEWLASVAGAMAFAIGMNVVWALVLNSTPSVAGVLGNFAGQFLWFAGLALFLRAARPVWIAVLLGALVAEFGDSALSLLWTSETWYSSLAAWSRSSAEPWSPAFIRVKLEMMRPLLDLLSACAFTGVVWGGRTLLVRDSE
jgi:hypothetical protein